MSEIAFDATDAAHVALYDESPLWSAFAGELLLDHVPLVARRALDLGCGAGYPAMELAERLGRQSFVVGVDPWATALERMQAKCRTWTVPQAAPVRGDGVNLPFRDGAFELITSNLGINNFADPERTLHECHRVLVPGGVLAMSTNVIGHFAQWYEAMAQVLTARADSAALVRLQAHIAHRGTAEELQEPLTQCGFRVSGLHTRTVHLRFGQARAVLDHHFMRLGFLAGWRAIAGDDADAVLAETARLCDANAGGGDGVRLDVPLVLLLARRV